MVFHIKNPKSMEAFYQESGRAQHWCHPYNKLTNSTAQHDQVEVMKRGCYICSTLYFKEKLFFKLNNRNFATSSYSDPSSSRTTPSLIQNKRRIVNLTMSHHLLGHMQKLVVL